MKNEKIAVAPKTVHSQRLKSFRTSAALILTTLMLMVATGATAQTFTTLHIFDLTDGADPYAGLIQATDGNLYGTTYSGGANEYDGTVFKITPSGTLTTLHSFDGTDGYDSRAGLVQATNGDFYGTTSSGGAEGVGTVFKITPGGALTTLHSFDGADGTYPYAGLVQATNGDLYGTTLGGNGVYGTVFKITPSGMLTTLHGFDITDGEYPVAGLVQVTNGDLYGVTEAGGTNGDGTVFKITPSGELTTLYSFCSGGDCTDGREPEGGLVQATDGNLYGTTYYGGANGYGTVFKITPSGTLTTLHSFDGTDGTYPYAGLIQDTNGTFYGTTQGGGSSEPPGYGTVFSLSVGLGPFVETQTTSGKEGTKIGILGQGFSSSSVVKFGGTQATTITLTGTTFISATVPGEALTGSVTVTTGTTTLTSTKTFDVLPTITGFTPESGPVGTPVTITGTGLKQTTKVTFDGKAATFTVISDTEVTADVPADAVTGKITVTTKGGSATSATSFTVD
jgi:uncharacterized repeat protein (TIGR03803 family)